MLGGGASMVYHFMGDDDIVRIMRHPMVSFASDAGVIEPGAGVPHPRGYGNNARVLGEFVRDRKVISLEDAVRKMTSLPAQHFGFAGRGIIAEGAAADLVLFDAARVRDLATYDKPHAYAEGIPHVLVNGTFVVRDGKTTGERPGKCCGASGGDTSGLVRERTASVLTSPRLQGSCRSKSCLCPRRFQTSRIARLLFGLDLSKNAIQAYGARARNPRSLRHGFERCSSRHSQSAAATSAPPRFAPERLCS